MRSEQFFFYCFCFLFSQLSKFSLRKIVKDEFLEKKKIIALKIILPYLQICKSRKFQRLEGRKIISN